MCGYGSSHPGKMSPAYSPVPTVSLGIVYVCGQKAQMTDVFVGLVLPGTRRSVRLSFGVPL